MLERRGQPPGPSGRGYEGLLPEAPGNCRAVAWVQSNIQVVYCDHVQLIQEAAQTAASIPSFLKLNLDTEKWRRVCEPHCIARMIIDRGTSSIAGQCPLRSMKSRERKSERGYVVAEGACILLWLLGSRCLTSCNASCKPGCAGANCSVVRENTPSPLLTVLCFSRIIPVRKDDFWHPRVHLAGFFQKLQSHLWLICSDYFAS